MYIFNKFPWEDSIDIELNTTLHSKVKDYQNDKLNNITFYEWYNGNWSEIINYTDIFMISGIFSAQSLYMNEYGNTYRWKVNTSDINGYYEEREFSFTTSFQ